MIYSSLPNVDIPNVTFDRYIFSYLERYGDKQALIDADNQQVFTFRQVSEVSKKYAKVLKHLGVRKGDMVAICISNCNDYPCIILGTSATGAILTTCNQNYTEEEIYRQFNNSKPSVVFVESQNYGKVKKVSENLNCIKHIISVDSCSDCHSLLDLFQKCNDEGKEIRKEQILPEDTCLLLYSSGTTGLPKGVMLSHRNVISTSQIFRTTLAARKMDVLYMAVPFFHVYGAIIMSLSFTQGATLVMRRRYFVEQFFQDVEKYKITYIQTVPPVVVDLNNSQLSQKYNLKSLNRIFCGAAPVPHGVADLVKKKFGLSIFQGWGTTEGVPLTISSTNTMIPMKSTGFVVPNTQIKVVNPNTGKELGSNEDGELLAKGPQVMKGYYKNSLTTASTIDKDGWLHTGDIGHYDENGLFYVVDRLKELIKYKGFQVAPAELEEVLLRHPMVRDAAVIGVPDPVAGEVPKAYIVKNKEHLSSGDIHEFLKGKISSFKYLRGGIVFCDSIPKSASGKILRRQLRALEQKSKL